MSIYYPQGAIELKIRWEDYGDTTNKVLNDVYNVLILARNIRVEINDYTEADTFSCEIDYKSFPFDPRTIRACGVKIHLEDRKKIFKGKNLDLLIPSEDNLIFTGFADEESIRFNDDTKTVVMEGRDFTSLLIDAKYDRESIPLSKPVDQIIQDLINSLKATEKITVVNRTGLDTLPTLSAIAPNFDKDTSVLTRRGGSSYWEMIQRVISRAALIGYIELDKFIINKPQNLYQRKNSKIFVNGKNVFNLSFKRKLGRFKGFNVRVVSLNLSDKENPVLEALIPEEATDPEIKGPRVKIEALDTDGKKVPIEDQKDAPFITFRVADIGNKEHLIKKAESIFTELSRQQLEGSFSTYEMEVPEDTGVGNGKYMRTVPVSFNKIRNATAIQIFIEEEDLKQIRNASTTADKKKFLLRKGYPNNVAEALSKSMAAMTTPFYTKAVTFTLDQEQGFQMDIEFINFIEIDNKKLAR